MTDEIANNNKIKHLEFIQLTITRMGVNSFVIKGWNITLISALFVFASKEAGKETLSMISIIATFIFWGVDGFFLQQERLFRMLYEVVRKKRPADIDFAMKTEHRIAAREVAKATYFQSVTSRTIAFFYMPLVIITSIAYIIIKTN